MIKASDELEQLTKHPGWVHVVSFMAKNKTITHSLMEKEVAVHGAWTIVKLVNTFCKYLMLLFENRAYNKIQNYVDVTINTGKKYVEQRSGTNRR